MSATDPQGHSWVLARRGQSIVILGVAIGAGVAVLLIGVVDPLRAYRHRVAEEIAEGQDRLEGAARFADAIDTLRAEREDLKKRLAQANSRLLAGDSGTLGAAALQERANTLAAEKNISVLSTQVMKEEEDEPFCGFRPIVITQIGPS